MTCLSSRGQKEVSRSYFDAVARDWFERAYDPDANFSTFPTGRVRQDITVAEMQRMNVGRKVVDFGCGIGQLVIELLKRDYDTVGLDHAPNMIREARRTLSQAFPKADGGRVFQVVDVLDVNSEKKFDVVTAMGVLEYLEDDSAFFEKVKAVLGGHGFAFVECRNRLFNITSANQYTIAAAESGDLRNLICQLDNVAKYSPTSLSEVWKTHGEMFGKIAKLLTEPPSRTADHEQAKQYPGRRRQHTPEELEAVLRRNGLKLKHVVYYHCHPYLPRYEREFPTIFNRIAFAMQPLGYTALGATICSAFVAVIEK